MMEYSVQSMVALVAIAIPSYLLFTAVQRLFLSPISHIPGPRLAAITSWYEVYYNLVQPGRYIWKIQELHTQYGPIIRVAPNEVHVNDVAILDEVFPTSTLRQRDKYVEGIGLGLGLTMAFTKKHDLHRARRDAMGPFFSQKSVLEVEPMIKAKVDQFRDVLLSLAKDGQVANISDIHFAFARDVVFEYCFSKRCNLLGDLPRTATLRRNSSNLLLGVHVQKYFPWLIKVIDSLEPLVGDRLTPEGVINLRELEQSIQEDINEILDRSRTPTKGRSVLVELRDHADLQKPHELPKRLLQEGAFLMLAATESVAATLSIVAFYLMYHKNVLRTLREELKPLGPDPSLRQLSTAPYLNAIIQEANRLSFGLPGRVTARVAPTEAIKYKNTAIPPGTIFGMTTLAVHTDESVFPGPYEFKPERWLGDEGKRRQKYQTAFGRGARKCLGMNLANAEMQLAVAMLAQFEMDLFETGVEDVLIQHEYQIAFPRLDSKGIRAKISGLA